MKFNKAKKNLISESTDMEVRNTTVLNEMFSSNRMADTVIARINSAGIDTTPRNIHSSDMKRISNIILSVVKDETGFSEFGTDEDNIRQIKKEVTMAVGEKLNIEPLKNGYNHLVTSTANKGSSFNRSYNDDTDYADDYDESGKIW